MTTLRLTYTTSEGRRFRWRAILTQTEVWIDRNGVEHPIEEMDPDYLANAIRWVRERVAPALRIQADARYAWLAAVLDSSVGPRGGMEECDAEQEVDEAWRETLIDWAQAPLVLAMEDRLRALAEDES